MVIEEDFEHTQPKSNGQKLNDIRSEVAGGIRNATRELERSLYAVGRITGDHMTLRPKHLLWPTDFSSLSLAAVDWVRSVRQLCDADLSIIHVCEPQITPPPGFPSLSPEALAHAHARTLNAASAQLGRLIDEEFQGDKEIRRKIVAGHAWVEISKYARESEVDLIIIASHGRTGLKHVLMGSVSERVVQHAFCPVLVVKSMARDPHA